MGGSPDVVCEDFTDGDGVRDVHDNCPEVPNASYLGTCVKPLGGVLSGTGVVCTGDGDCGVGETCDLNQGDGNSNGIGDCCECYADIDGNTKVDLSDLVIMKNEFLQPCPPSVCSADCNGDNKVDLSDLVIMKGEFLNTGCPV